MVQIFPYLYYVLCVSPIFTQVIDSSPIHKVIAASITLQGTSISRGKGKNISNPAIDIAGGYGYVSYQEGKHSVMFDYV